ncbi:MAG: hypothetical protein Q8L54_00810 [Devosia sp.]|nr:hypothetical protein [Devosia sp.]
MGDYETTRAMAELYERTRPQVRQLYQQIEAVAQRRPDRPLSPYLFGVAEELTRATLRITSRLRKARKLTPLSAGTTWLDLGAFLTQADKLLDQFWEAHTLYYPRGERHYWNIGGMSNARRGMRAERW